jgi:N-methylhydantoinase B
MKRVSSNLYSAEVDGREMLHCRCGAVLGPADKDPKSLLRSKSCDLAKAGPNVNPYDIGGRRFSLREYYCPACLRLVEVDVAPQAS